MILPVAFWLCMVIWWTHSCPESCRCLDADLMQCTGYIPKDIPSTVVRVTIANPPKEPVSSEMFAGLNWSNISLLTIKCDPNEHNYTGYIRLDSEAFKELISLRHLSVIRFDQRASDSIECDTFKGIQGLKSLNLEGNLYFSTHRIVCAIQSYLHALEVINLADVEMRSTGHIDTNFMLAIQKTQVRVLDISGLVFGLLQVEKVTKLFPYLQTVFLRRCKNMYYPLNVLHDANFQIPQSLQAVDLSESTFIAREWGLHYSYYTPNLLPYKHIRKLILNGIFDLVNFYGGVLSFSGNLSSNMIFLWEEIEMMRNGFQWLNFSSPDKLPFLKSLNVAYNKISYLSPKMTESFQNLKVLNVSHNRLKRMENKPEFSYLLAHLQKLETASLSGNGLSTLPRHFFRNNNHLTVIDLSSNKLEQVDFQINHLEKLNYLNLHSNRLKTITEGMLFTFQFIRDLQSRNFDNETAFEVNISNNPFVCGCDAKSEANFRQIVQYPTMFGDSKVVCYLEGSDVTINAASLLTIRKTCQRTTIIITVCACLASMVIIIIVTFCVVNRLLKRYRKKQHLLDLIKLYKDPDKEPDFLVFLSYSSCDADFVDEMVHPQLEGKLQQLLQTETELVCNGDLHFVAGRRIEDEIVKAVEASKVVILLISNAFCSSPWCDYETMVSYYEKKPIILVLKEDVPKGTMPSVLRKLFNRYVRATWTNVNGTMTLRPSWDKVCQSIIDHANI